MGVQHIDAAKCKHCGKDILYQLSTFESPLSDPKWKTKADPPQAVSCPECKNVYMIQDLQPTSIAVDHEQWAIQEKVPVVIAVQARCDDPDCKTPLTILAVRISGTTCADVLQELSKWTLHDLVCPKSHPVTRVVADR